ncbi:conjugative transposon protein TraM [Arenibacter troitsensis]|uniref:Conjugative transposon TraM C-terminal domain-containing protein n=1 Tax=Arenibacter troitsensis TaxID=188872 RepID=A0A1X7LH03_9FLAO|nr:conjugative transposon protein TraM [Arenibacter troitsensis]SMG52459.1 Protein of unknown function [Arenibacter troitsensis]
MKIEKNKIVFTSILLCILLFITAYAVLVLDSEQGQELEADQIPVPEIMNEQKIYDSKLDAINDMKTARPTLAPSVYDEDLLDSTGLYDPELLDKKKMQLVDSIYKQGQMRYSKRTGKTLNGDTLSRFQSRHIKTEKTDEYIGEKEIEVASQTLALEHQLFFDSHPIETIGSGNSDPIIMVRVDGDQTVKADQRLRMRLIKDAKINNVLIPKNTRIYGFVSFKPNRTLIRIENIDHLPVKFKAYDLEDGSEGIYLRNNFRAEATNEVVNDIVDDINITGMPQIKGVRKVFQRNRRSFRASISDNYKLILKYDKNNFKINLQ